VNASSTSTPTSLLFQDSNNKDIYMDVASPKFNFLNKAKVLIKKSRSEEEKVVEKKAATPTQQPSVETTRPPGD
jgi:hypothetical protein